MSGEQQEPQTFMAFDYGLRRLGVAVGNRLTRQAQALETIELKSQARWRRIEELLQEWQPDALVVGVPFHPDGAEHENTQRARQFMRQLQRFSKPVFEVDERYSTVEALSLPWHQQKHRGLDALAAQVILQTYFLSLP